MLTFLPGSQTLAIAGLAAAAAPVVIHLLNRSRYRVLDWAAMDFLLEASSRSRSLVQLRDLLVLALRTAAVALFGLAVARPYLSSRAGAAAATGPVHAILVIDNSLSMGRERLGGVTLLDDARDRAREFVARLPAGSRTSVVPLCGPAGSFTLDARTAADDIAEALDAIAVVDRPAAAAAAIDLAARAARLAPDLPDKRVVMFGDQQQSTWPADAAALAPEGDAAAFDGLQIVQVATADRDNSWVESLRLEDGIGDPETPATFTAVIRHEAAAARTSVPVTLSIDGVERASVTVDLEPGQTREVAFEHEFDVLPTPARPAFVTATVALPPDQLPDDDRRTIVVPVVAALPVVFVDQFGAAGENPRLGRYGETRHLRRLLAPVVAGEERRRQLVDVRHVRIDELDRELLADARLVVIAGVAAPGDAPALLREYVEQGGRLLVAAGGDFNPLEWNAGAWLDGRGILPVPLTGVVGRLPEAPGDLEPFFLDWKTMKDDGLFRVPGAAEDELVDLYESPVFLQAVTSDLTMVAESAADDVALAEAARLERAELAASIARLGGLEAAGRATAADREALRLAREREAEINPDWLTWAPRDNGDDKPPRGPRVLAAFDNGVPFLVSREIGRGCVTWAASGVFSPWNTLPRSNAILLFDRLLRSELAATLPDLTVETADELVIPLADEDRRATIRLKRPDGAEESLAVEAIGGERAGVTIRDLTKRGGYMLTATRNDAADRAGGAEPIWTLPLAANGPAWESEPALLDAAAFAERTRGTDAFRWVGPDAVASVDGARVRGQGSWWWLLLAALGCLVAENVVLARTDRELASEQAVS